MSNKYGLENLTLTWQYAEYWGKLKPNAKVFVFGDERLRWGEFSEKVDWIAMAFMEVGIKKGDRIAFFGMARNEFLPTYMAANKIGAVWLGLNPKFSLEELLYQIGDSQPSILITARNLRGKDLAPTVKALVEKFPFIKKVLVMGEAFKGTENFQDFTREPRSELREALTKRAADVWDSDPALLMYTSGSTGKPKGVVHTHRSIIENIKVEIEKFYIEENTRALLHFPINHVAADVEIGFAIIMAGGSAVLMDQFDPVASLRVIEKERVTMVLQAPVMYLLQMRQPEFMKTNFKHVKLFAWGGSAAPKQMIDTLKAICEKTGAMLVTGYGSTEVCGFVTYTERDDGLNTHLKTAGRIVPPFQLKIVDAQRRTLPNGEIGEIAVRGPCLFKEYLKKPDATAQVIDSEGWYYTSDLAYKNDRDYIVITGRKSEMFKTGGENVFPREIEEVLEAHSCVLFAAVIAIPDDLYQEVGWAFIVPKPGSNVSEQELQQFSKDRLANYKIPKKFIIRSTLPLLGTGKVDKLALKKEIWEMSKK